MITQEELKSRVSYDQLTGIFIWLNGQCEGKEVGCIKDRGYLYAKINGFSRGMHRWAFLYMTGSIPDVIDHKDQDPSNNIWDNLRKSDKVANAVNCDVSKNNKEGIKGLCFDKHNSNWKGQCKINGKILTKSNKNKSSVLEWLETKQQEQRLSVGI